MSNTYQLGEVNKLGDYSDQYGQSFWATTSDGKTVKFNSKTKEIANGSSVTAETAEVRTSKKGTEYYQLKKVTVNQPEQTDTQSPTPGQDFAVMMKKMIRVEKYVKELHQKVVLEGETNKVKEVFDTDDDEPVDLSTIPF